tara:strand:+ start:1376 stop:1573 length:198 start_codon:yes stop_codon:yes gene_type:complete
MLKPAGWNDLAGAWNAGGWVSKFDDSDTIYEYSGSEAQTNAQTKADELAAADNSGRKYMIEEVVE